MEQLISDVGDEIATGELEKVLLGEILVFQLFPEDSGEPRMVEGVETVAGESELCLDFIYIDDWHCCSSTINSLSKGCSSKRVFGKGGFFCNS